MRNAKFLLGSAGMVSRREQALTTGRTREKQYLLNVSSRVVALVPVGTAQRQGPTPATEYATRTRYPLYRLVTVVKCSYTVQYLQPGETITLNHAIMSNVSLIYGIIPN